MLGALLAAKGGGGGGGEGGATSSTATSGGTFSSGGPSITFNQAPGNGGNSIMVIGLAIAGLLAVYMLTKGR